MEDLKKIPHDPGCYIFKDIKGNIIYVGKAKDLKKRVSSYFGRRHDHAKTASLASSVESIDFIATGSEVEALILENNLIKKHQPKYNIDLKDAKRYAYIQLTDEPFPRLVVARKPGRPNSFGPFVSAQERDYVLKAVRNAFRIRTCKRLCKRPGLRHHLGLCAACGVAREEDYNALVKQATQVLKGATVQLLDDLERQMKEASRSQEYEKAQVLRDRISALKSLEERQNMERAKKYDEDIINFIQADGIVHLLLFHVRHGILDAKEEFEFRWSPDFLNEFLLQHYTQYPAPKEIIIPQEADPALALLFTKRKGSMVTISVPKHGPRRELLDLAHTNVKLHFFGNNFKTFALQEALGLSNAPKVIECFDISHLSGTSMVGSMVQFRDGKPDKPGYRRFRIRTVEQVDDFRAIEEVVQRRYQRLKSEQACYPDLVIIDGGKGQLSSAMRALKNVGISIPTIAIAKRLEEIYLPGLPFPKRMDRRSPALLYLREIRDEGHRFAIKYNRVLRSKKMRD